MIAMAGFKLFFFSFPNHKKNKDYLFSFPGGDDVACRMNV